MTTYQVTVTYIDGETITTDFDNARKAERFARNEVKYENTARAICPALGLDLAGDFASFHPTN
jgi:hypothetical protein